MSCSNPFYSPGPCQPSVLPAARKCGHIWVQWHANGSSCARTWQRLRVQRHADGSGPTSASEHVFVRRHANGSGCDCTSTRCPSPPAIWLVHLLHWAMCALVQKVLGNPHPHRGADCVCPGGGLGPHCRSTKWQRWTRIRRINVPETTSRWLACSVRAQDKMEIGVQAKWICWARRLVVSMITSVIEGRRRWIWHKVLSTP